MKKSIDFVISAIVLALLIMANPGAFCQVAPTTNWSTLVNDYATCQGVDSNNNPVNRADTFSSTDSYVYSWIAFQNVPPQNHTVVWYWYMPNGTLYTESSYTIPNNNGLGWGSYNVWGDININGYLPSHILGTWSVKTYVDGEALLIQSFTISSSAPSSYISGVPYDSQETNTWCGPATLQMVLGYYGVQKSQSEIAASVYNQDNKTTYTNSMQVYPQQLGFNSTMSTGSIEALKQDIQNGIPTIVLQRVSDSDSEGHYRVVVGYDDLEGVFITDDPGQSANYNITYGDFVALWNNISASTTVNWTLTIVPYVSSPNPSSTPISAQPTNAPSETPMTTPEFPSLAILVLFMAVMIIPALALAMRKKKVLS